MNILSIVDFVTRLIIKFLPETRHSKLKYFCTHRLITLILSWRTFVCISACVPELARALTSTAHGPRIVPRFYNITHAREKVPTGPPSTPIHTHNHSQTHTICHKIINIGIFRWCTILSRILNILRVFLLFPLKYQPGNIQGISSLTG